jgi:hypothetical protein
LLPAPPAVFAGLYNFCFSDMLAWGHALVSIHLLLSSRDDGGGTWGAWAYHACMPVDAVSFCPCKQSASHGAGGTV